MQLVIIMYLVIRGVNMTDDRSAVDCEEICGSRAEIRSMDRSGRNAENIQGRGEMVLPL